MNLLFLSLLLLVIVTISFGFKQQSKHAVTRLKPVAASGSSSVLAAATPAAAAPAAADGDISTEIVSGLTVALATIPTSIAYGTIVGISPLLGIWTSILVGGVVGLSLMLGSKGKLALTPKGGSGPGVIAGAAGVVAIPLAKLSSQGMGQYMGTVVVMAGLIEVLLAVLRTGKLADEVPEVVVAGFLNTFAIFLVQSQMKVFKYAGAWLTGADMNNAILVASASAAAIKLIPMVTKKIPAALGGLVTATALAKILKLPVQTLADLAAKSGGKFAGGLAAIPALKLPVIPGDFGVIQQLLPVALGIALISIIETLLAAKIAAKSSTGGVEPAVDPDKLMMGLGLGNAVSSVIGGIGGCGLIPNTILNKTTGGKGALSALAYGVVLSLLVILAAPLLGQIPMPALAGLMFVVATNTFEWHETEMVLKHAADSKMPAQKYFDLIGMLVTMYTCYAVDMGVGIVLGVAVTRFLDIVKNVKKLFGAK